LDGLIYYLCKNRMRGLTNSARGEAR